MRRLLILSMAFLPATVSVTLPTPPYTAVGNNYGVTMNGGSFQPGWDWSNTVIIDAVLENDAGFLVSYHINFSAPTENPDPSISDYIYELNSNAGAFSNLDTRESERTRGRLLRVLGYRQGQS